MQAALTAAERGNEVVLAESGPALGGTINFTDKHDDKVDLRNVKNVIIRDSTDKGNRID